jgi:hypothetical protein
MESIQQWGVHAHLDVDTYGDGDGVRDACRRSSR